jgi:excisionase family DNA binding protein
MGKEFYTVKEIADTLEVKVETVQNWIRDKKLPAYKIGNTYRVRAEDFERFLEERRTTQDKD